MPSGRFMTQITLKILSRLLIKFAASLDKKDRQSCLKLYEQLKKETKDLMQQFNAFSKAFQQRSEVCKYWNGFIYLISILHNLISADRERDWKGHLRAIQDQLSTIRYLVPGKDAETRSKTRRYTH